MLNRRGVTMNTTKTTVKNFVNLVSDCTRRDVTINSMAVRLTDWNYFVQTQDENVVVDPHGGLTDIRNKVLRHTSNAFTEDPLRILRVVRLSVVYGLDIHADTISLMKHHISDLLTISKERIWIELEKNQKRLNRS